MMNRQKASGKKRAGGISLILQGMKKTKTLALAQCVLTFSAAFLIPLRNALAAREKMASGASWNPVLYGVLQLNPFILVSFMFYAPLLTLSAFSFLNDRAGSDFYHAAAKKRVRTAFDFYLSQALWILIFIIGSLLVTCVSSWLFRDFFHFDRTKILCCFLQLSAASLLTEGAVLTAMTLTGTFFTNIVLALLLIFVPSLLLKITAVSLTEMVAMLDMSYLPAFFAGRMNAVTGIVLNALIVGDKSVLYDQGSIVYTFLAAGFYLGLGILLYGKRPSETAGRPALGRKTQGVIRVLIAFLISLPACMIFLTANAKSYPQGEMGRFSFADLSPDELILLGTLLLCALGAMLVYELLTVRRLPGWKKFLKDALLLFCLDAVWILGMTGIEAGYRNEAFPPSEIESVSFPMREQYYRSGPSACFDLDHYGWNQSYFDSKLDDVIFQDPELMELISQRHRETAEANKGDVDWETGDSYKIQEGEYFSSILTRIHLRSGKDVHRILVYSGEDLTRIWDNLASIEAGRQLLELPDYINLNWVYLTGVEEQEQSLPIRDLYECYREEFRKMTPEEAVSLLEDLSSYKDRVLINFNLYLKGDYRYASLPVTDSFPETQKKLDDLGVKVMTTENVSEPLTGLGAGALSETETEAEKAGEPGSAPDEAESGIIGGADGPTTIFLAGKLPGRGGAEMEGGKSPESETEEE